MSTADWLLIVIIAFVLIDFAAGRVINFLNENSKNQPLGPEAADIYSEAEYQKSMAYGTANYKLESFSSVISTSVILAAIILGFFANSYIKVKSASFVQTANSVLPPRRLITSSLSL